MSDETTNPTADEETRNNECFCTVAVAGQQFTAGPKQWGFNAETGVFELNLLLDGIDSTVAVPADKIDFVVYHEAVPTPDGPVKAQPTSSALIKPGLSD